MHHPQFICIEGLDGVGKTAIAKELADRLGYFYYRSPGGAYKEIRERVDMGDLDPLSRYLFYRAATQNDSRLINDLLKIKGVVCDRYIFSTFAYHAALDSRVVDCHSEVGLRMPDFCVLLVATLEVRLERLALRPVRNKYETDTRLQAKIQELFESFKFSTIDTSLTTVSQATDLLVGRILDVRDID